MTTITIELTGVPEQVLNNAIKKGYAKTKADALRMALVQFGQDLNLINLNLHSKAEAYAYVEIKK